MCCHNWTMFSISLLITMYLLIRCRPVKKQTSYWSHAQVLELNRTEENKFSKQRRFYSFCNRYVSVPVYFKCSLNHQCPPCSSRLERMRWEGQALDTQLYGLVHCRYGILIQQLKFHPIFNNIINSLLDCIIASRIAKADGSYFWSVRCVKTGRIMIIQPSVCRKNLAVSVHWSLIKETESLRWNIMDHNCFLECHNIDS